MINITKYRKIYYLISGLMIATSIFSLVYFGLKFGIDFKGGSLMEIEFSEKRLENNLILENLKNFNLGEIVIQPIGERGMILRFKDVDEKNHQEIFEKIKKTAEELSPTNILKEKSFESIGPIIGQELKKRSFYAVILVLLAIVAYIAFAFRKVSYPLASWRYGTVTLAALFHDVIIPLGAAAFLGYFSNLEINAAFIAAILTVMGYSVHDTIIIFDRIRENLMKIAKRDFEEIVNLSLNQTFVRSLNTSLTVLLVLLAIYLFGGETIKNFALILIIGISVGTYSSIFIASPLLVSWKNRPLAK